MDDFALALAHYRVLFPDLTSLGEGTPPATWYTEYNRVTASGLTATLLTRTSMDGGGADFVKNYDQRALLSALHARRAELDCTYRQSVAQPSPVITAAHGSIYRLGW